MGALHHIDVKTNRTTTASQASGRLVFTPTRTFRKATHFFVGIAGNAEQANGGKHHSEPAQAENDPKQHHAL
jgi:hypothetical protein